MRGTAAAAGFSCESAGEMLLVGGRGKSFEVWKLDAERASLKPVRNLGSRALFVSEWRCLSVDADKFPSIRGNCIILHSRFPILRVYDLADGSVISLDVTESSQSPEDQDEDVAGLIHLLSDYCSNNPKSQLGVEHYNKELNQTIRACLI